MKHIPLIVVLAGVLGASTAAESQPRGPYGWILPATQAAGRQVFEEHCAACHSPRSGTPYGPSLVGVVGRRAGSVAGFPYSEALKTSGLVWTDDNLLKWIA